MTVLANPGKPTLVVLPGPGVGVSLRVVAELGKRPRTVDLAGLAQMDLNVRLPAKTGSHLLGEHVHLPTDHGQEHKIDGSHLVACHSRPRVTAKPTISGRWRAVRCTAEAGGQASDGFLIVTVARAVNPRATR